ncbi:MAG: hypothetical protein ACP5TL_02210 [Candidatus Micrarchaeia archaeon]
MAEMWSDYTGAIIGNLDSSIKKKYGFSLSDLLSNPKALAGQENISVKISNIKSDVNSFIDSQKQDALRREKTFNDILERADSITNKIAQKISVVAKQNNIPIIKPIAVNRNTDNEDHIYIDSSDDNVLAMVEKLVSSSVIVADFTTEYNNLKIGDWHFNGQKNYSLTVYTPTSNVMLLDSSRDELNTLLDAAAEFISG